MEKETRENFSLKKTVVKKVGKKYVDGHKTKTFTYDDVIYDSEGWADVEKFLPRNHDLLYLKVQGKKPFSGWISGDEWFGIRLNKKDKVIGWKIRPQDKVL